MLRNLYRRRLLQFLKARVRTKSGQGLIRQDIRFASAYLDRDIWISLLLPPGFPKFLFHYPLLLFNDGQDLDALRLEQTLRRLYSENKIEPFVVAAIHTDANRMHDYGTAGIPDYKNRGAGAFDYTCFVLDELIPFLMDNYQIEAPGGYVFAGSSLGGLSAFDIVWNHPEYFAKAGIFSGSFWWRSKPASDEDPDADRIMHEIVAKGRYVKGQQFWFQTGTQDEPDDRNYNGIIDSIDDTVDLIKALEKHGYSLKDNIKYVEVKGGRHDQNTWGKVMPDFLLWAFGKENKENG